jgi:hypothetical protein
MLGRWPAIQVRTYGTLPSFPERTNSAADARKAPLRRWVPTCTTRSYLRAASTILRPSTTLCETGFST